MAWHPLASSALILAVLISGASPRQLAAQIGATPTLATRVAAAMTYDPSIGGVVLIGGESPALGTLDDFWVRTTGPWQRVNLPGTPCLAGAATAYLPTLPGIVMVGGATAGGSLVNTTWVFSGNNWSQTTTPATMLPRRNALLAYDEQRQVLVLHGGEGQVGLLDDTWTFTPQTGWVQVQTAPPPATASRGMAWNPVNQRITLVVGGTIPAHFLEFDGANWILRLVDGSATQYELIEGFGVATMPGNGGFTGIGVFGGYRSTIVGMPGTPGMISGARYIWNGTSTVPAVTGNSPDIPRRDSLVTATPGAVLMHGGSTAPGGGSRLLNDSWGWGGSPFGGWGLLAGQRALVLADSCHMAHTGKVLVYGGKSVAGGTGPFTPLHDAYTWSNGAWQQVRFWLGLPFGNTTPTWDHAVAYDPVRGVAVVTDLTSTLEYNGSTWATRSSSTPAPGGRMAFDPGSQSVLYHHGPSGDTWSWSGSAWTLRASTPTFASPWTVLVLDGGRNEVLAINQLGTRAWNGSGWTPRGPAPVTWSVPVHSGVTWDASRDRVLLLENDGASPSAQRPWLWEWDGQAWSNRGQLGVTLQTAYPTLSYDPQLQASVLLADSETWLLSSVHPAGWTVLGVGCPGPTGGATLARSGTGPWVDDILRTQIAGAAGQTPLFGVFGFGTSTWNNLPLPLELAFAGMPGCSLYVDVLGVQWLAGSTWDFPIPNVAALAGAVFHQQAAVAAPGANPTGAIVTNAGTATIGLR